MSEEAKAREYLTRLDRILAGEREPEPGAEGEAARLLSLARIILTAGFNCGGSLGEVLYRRILEQAVREDELTEEELDYASAGLAGPGREPNCPFCGAGRRDGRERCSSCGR